MRGFVLAFLFAGCIPSPEDLVPHDAPPFADQDFGPVVTSEIAPPPISGGTLLAAQDGTVWASDPDRDLVWHVDVDGRRVLSASALEPGDEPGRLAEDETGRVHVVLRRAGEIASIEPGFAQRVVRRAICAEPRGIAYDGGENVLYVACSSGDLVKIPTDGGAEIRRRRLDSDLRDVVLFGPDLLVSRFRDASVLWVTRDMNLIDRFTPVAENFMGPSSPAVAWRLVGTPDGGAAMTYQAELDTEVGTGPGAYYGSIVDTNVFVVGPDATEVSMLVSGTTLPVDLAFSPDDYHFSVVAAGTREVTQVSSDGYGGYGGFGGGFGYGGVQDPYPDTPQPIAVVYDAEGRRIVQTREPYAIEADGASISLGDPSRADSGHETFHTSVASSRLACASCHPEGREDGHVWMFSTFGPRRTQSLAGGLQGRAPFHWSGDLPSFQDLMGEVFVNRMMALPAPSDERIVAVETWLDTAVPAPVAEAPIDEAAAARGRALFEGDAACVTCHAGEFLTNDRTVDVGTRGGPFQVPSLVGVFARAPFMHDGCADDLRERFDPACGGSAHGRTDSLSEGDVEDLVAYLETL